jgi:hypothetical protein
MGLQQEELGEWRAYPEEGWEVWGVFGEQIAVRLGGFLCVCSRCVSSTWGIGWIILCCEALPYVLQDVGHPWPLPTGSCSTTHFPV